MTLPRFRFRSPSMWPLLTGALVCMLMPAASVSAQELPRVQVTRGETTIRAMRYNNSQVWRLMQAQPGMVFDVIDVDGDQQQHRDDNYYLVLLPRDAWGTQWVGWISGRYVAPAPPRERAVAPEPLPMPAAASAPRVEDTAAPAPVSTAAATPPPAFVPATRTLPDVVLRFAFDRSDLSEAARETLSAAMTTMSAEGGPLTFALGGHTDSIGSDAYNQKLGLARAEAVRAFIVEQLKIPAERVSVSSHGESQPVAPNTTRDGRAENRRVVVTVTAPVSAAAAR